jgi:hypothetical protein
VWCKSNIPNWVRWCTPVVPDTREVEEGRSQTEGTQAKAQNPIWKTKSQRTGGVAQEEEHLPSTRPWVQPPVPPKHTHTHTHTHTYPSWCSCKDSGRAAWCHEPISKPAFCLSMQHSKKRLFSRKGSMQGQRNRTLGYRVWKRIKDSSTNKLISHMHRWRINAHHMINTVAIVKGSGTPNYFKVITKSWVKNHPAF